MLTALKLWWTLDVLNPTVVVGGNLNQRLMLFGVYVESDILGHAEHEPVMDWRGAQTIKIETQSNKTNLKLS